MSEALEQTEEERALERIARNQLLIQELTQENDALKGYFKGRPDEYQAGTTKRVGKFYIKVSAGSRIDDTLAKREFPPHSHKHLYKWTVDAKMVRAYLKDEQIDKITKKFDNRIEIGIN